VDPGVDLPKDRLALAAVKQFGARPFDDVTVTELAVAANVTTGVVYHHFRSKLGLYTFVRRDVERRLLDRMEGEANSRGAGLGPVGIGDDCLTGRAGLAVREGYLRILRDPSAGSAAAQAQGTRSRQGSRGGLVCCASTIADGVDAEQARVAITTIRLHPRPRLREPPKPKNNRGDSAVAMSTPTNNPDSHRKIRALGRGCHDSPTSAGARTPASHDGNRR
jgi:AcrR family transcriptional regulator